MKRFALIIAFISFVIIAFSQENDIQTTKELEQKADTLYKAFNYDSAAYYYSEAALNYELNKDWLNSVKNYRLTARAFFMISKVDTALYFVQKALDITNVAFKMDVNEEILEVIDIYIVKGNICYKIPRYDLELLNYQKALYLILKMDSLPKLKLADIWIHIGIAYDDLGRFKKAIEYFKKSLYLKQKMLGEEHIDIANCFDKLGIVFSELNDNDIALEYLQKALRIKIKNLGEQNSYVAYSYNRIGGAYINNENYTKALEYIQKSLAINIRIYGEQDPYVAHNYQGIGIVYKELGEYDKALDYFNKANQINIAKFGENHPYVASNYNNIGNVYKLKRDYSQAIKYLQKSLSICIHSYGEKHPRVALMYSNISKIYTKAGDYNNALNNIQKSIIANIVDFSNANLYINPIELNPFSKPDLVETLYNKAKILYLLSINAEQSVKELNASIETFNLAVNLTYQMRSDYSHESTQLLLSENTKNYFADALLAAIEYNIITPCVHAKEKPFEYLEKSKSATLGAYLNDMQIRSYWSISDSLQIKEKDISVQRNKLDTKLQQAKATKEGYDTLLVQGYQDKLFNISRQYDTLITTLKTQYPDYYQVKYQQNVATINELQQQMDNKTALLNYFVADTSLFIAAITKDSVVYRIIKTDSLFNEQLIDYHIDIEFNFTKDELQESTSLYNYLIAPVEDLIKGKNKLVIIPDEKLYYVPFETLCKKGDDVNHPDYLIKNYAINYHHSATLWLNSKEKENKSVAQNSFIGFAPVFDPEVKNGYIVSNDWLADTTDVNMAATRSVSNDFGSFNALPNTEDEIKSILKLFNKKGDKADGYLYKEASEENFKKNANNYKYIHIASHSFTNDKYPALSGIAFSQPDTTNRKENDEDGILYAGESYNLNLSNADLVVLSSCKSGLGKLIKGEGFLSLSRGFLYSGTPNIVYSLWSVNDEPTKNLMVYFYKQVLSGKSYADALRIAKLKIMNNPKTAQPKYWAAWVLLGK